MFNIVCKYCNKNFQARYSKRKFCSYDCAVKWRTGKTLEEIGYNKESIQKMHDEFCKRNKSQKHREYLSKKFKGRKMSPEWIEKIRQAEMGNTNNPNINEFPRSIKGKSLEEIYGERSEEIREHMRQGQQKRQELNGHKPPPQNYDKEIMIKKLKESLKHHNETVLDYADILSKKGYRCIPIIGFVPDLIAVKNNNIYSIEIDNHLHPNFKKYNEERQKYFDDIIWILTRYTNKKVIKVKGNFPEEI